MMPPLPLLMFYLHSSPVGFGIFTIGMVATPSRAESLMIASPPPAYVQRQIARNYRAAKFSYVFDRNYRLTTPVSPASSRFRKRLPIKFQQQHADQEDKFAAIIISFDGAATTDRDRKVIGGTLLFFPDDDLDTRGEGGADAPEDFSPPIHASQQMRPWAVRGEMPPYHHVVSRKSPLHDHRKAFGAAPVSMPFHRGRRPGCQANAAAIDVRQWANLSSSLGLRTRREFGRQQRGRRQETCLASCRRV